MICNDSVLGKDIEQILIPEQQIKRRVKQMADQLVKDYEGKDLIMIGILNGASVFYIDLMMEMDIPVEMNFMAVSSYGNGTVSSGRVRIEYDLETDIENKHVLIVEDIVDSGRTMDNLIKLLTARKPASIKICTFLDKEDRREVDLKLDYVGFKVPDVFIVGYGLDYAGKYRNLRYIGTLKPEIYE